MSEFDFWDIKVFDVYKYLIFMMRKWLFMLKKKKFGFNVEKSEVLEFIFRS